MRTKHLIGAALLGVVGFLAMPTAAFAGTSATEHFTLVFSSQTGPGAIFATGAFKAGGTDYQGKRVDEAVFPDGAFKINHGAIHATFSFNSKTCTGRLSGSGPYKISGGYGAYTGIKGTGTATLHGTIETARNANGTCNPNDISAYTLTVHASGPVSL